MLDAPGDEDEVVKAFSFYHSLVGATENLSFICEAITKYAMRILFT